VKQLTGGDRVTARFMRADFFDYTPQFKLLFIGNKKPILRGFHMIPFSVTTEGEARPGRPRSAERAPRPLASATT
jgi:putative DNA primase/helicase